MLRRLSALLACAGLLAAGASTSSAAPTRPGGPQVAPLVAGLPDTVPPAARWSEPALPQADGWPFGDAFPRTSGTGRLASGASFWSDFLYDDHGAFTTTTAAQSAAIASLAAPDGGYTYPDGEARGNGADVFRNAVGLDSRASYWRVDWNTLTDPDVPLAVWGLDTDGSTASGTRAWPAGTGVSSPGLDRALVVSSRGAWLLPADGGAGVDVSSGLTVDREARSFVVRVPRSVLPVSGTWRVRLVAGLADASGRAMAPATGARPGGTAVYNASYRSVATEPQQYEQGALGNRVGTTSSPRATDMGNYWMEDHQAEALAAGDVTPFAQDLVWSQLARRASTPEPLVAGWSNRWYVSNLDLGQGVVEDQGSGAGDLEPNFLGRVQPYAVYVPTTYRLGTPTPLTWMLHSLSVQHNQYGALDPVQVRQTCEDRRSICATTLGRGPDLWYFDEAETDFWEVWNRLARSFTLDPERTVISGFSMGGYAAYKLGLAHPDLFAKAMALAAPPTCGIRVVGDVRTPGGGGRCTTDGDTLPLVGNARNLPFVIAHGGLDELVPYTSVRQQVQAFDDAGYRYRFHTYPAEGHIPYAAKDAFAEPTAELGRTTREVPARIDHRWYPHLDEPALGIGTRHLAWLRDLQARTSTPGTLARVTAHSTALRDPQVTVHAARGLLVPGDPSPGTFEEQTWQRTGSAPLGRRLTLGLEGVARVRVDAARAGLSGPGDVALAVESDGPASVSVSGLRPGTRVLVGGRALRADRTGAVTLRVR